MACWNLQSLSKLNMNASEENLHLMNYEVINFAITTLHLCHATVVVYELIAAVVDHGTLILKQATLFVKKVVIFDAMNRVMHPIPITQDFEYGSTIHSNYTRQYVAIYSYLAEKSICGNS